jgi:hypothetical protein
VTPTRSQLLAQLTRLRKGALFSILQAAAAAHGLAFPFVLAVGSRESNLVNRLGDWRGPSSGRAGEYHGVGILQIDVQHEIARVARDTGTWKTYPAPLVDFGCAILANNLHRAWAHNPEHTLPQHLKVAASGYNAGMVAAWEGVTAGDSDKFTTGADYGKDVCARMGVFADLLAVHP